MQSFAILSKITYNYPGSDCQGKDDLEWCNFVHSVDEFLRYFCFVAGKSAGKASEQPGVWPSIYSRNLVFSQLTVIKGHNTSFTRYASLKLYITNASLIC